MDIYILHKGQESGPYSEKTVSQLLDQGSIEGSDLAWRQGLPDWKPLTEVLAAKPEEHARSEKPSEPEKIEEKSEPKPARSKVPATAKQKALLAFLRMNPPADLTKDDASQLINDAMEDSKHAERLTLWNEERFRLHPELFAAEIQARKENRGNHFFALCESAGADYFNGISKAHCQVLVSFLDVKFPHWDAVESEAAEHYFFPAVAEKFPQLVQKQWRGRLNYSDGSKVSSEIVKRSATSKIRQTRTSPAGAVFKGTVIGLVILGALYLGHRTLRQQVTAASPGNPPSSAEPASPPAPQPAPTPVPVLETAPQLATVTPKPVVAKAKARKTVVPSPATPTPMLAAATPPELSAPAPMGDAPGMAPMAPPSMGEPPAPITPPPPTLPIVGSLPSAPSSPMGSSDLTPPILGPDPTTGAVPPPTTIPPNPPPVAPPTASTTAAARINLLLTRPVEIQLAYGKIMLPPGTAVKLMARQGVLLKVAYQSSVITVPISSTDLE